MATAALRQDETGVDTGNTVEDRIAAVRRFNRFYTREIGFLHEHLHDSGFVLSEARVLYELAHCGETTATELRRETGLDAGYLSRLLRRFEDKGLLARRPSPEDGRQSLLSLTPEGQKTFARLDAAARREVGALVAPLPEDAQEKLVAAMAALEGVLGTGRLDPARLVLRRHRPGDLGWIVARHGALYAEEYGWDASFEGLAAKVVGEIAENFDPVRERIWIAEHDGVRLGSICLVRQSDEVAKLRLLLVEPAARGLGLGRRLVAECIAFARAAGYARITLWTNDVLTTARAIYAKAGFRLVASEPHRSFGQDLVGETWELDL
ncbi:DNA-binding MarR family transcriptional regulator/predicted GNAT family acetyltransferase [Chelatococcus caeni]|uniref:DNA-binding MarR family transcriptional regulator/predicted GNAT family acetyltransferase n=1 Tax=Chelatococcus caeni TaxID=1348468 RepID=A0A840BZH7_9HYPH|nr:MULTISPECIES: helix-turn-helix domain-containing GNAT family N-acetyltransferase [Chelatococcus]ALA17123.1 MarR family transcriptional regulator [Chelatococcus sp. CO-6]MBB4017122.1 DNA-binding MarR family transcriptional regulator/predicted GNAT family acetyltransferase [Chelatococcus caeni]